MDKASLSRFAPRERDNLRQAVEKRLEVLGITAANKLEKFNDWLITEGGVIWVNGRSYIDYSKQTFEQLFREYQKAGYDQLVEELAYTWFNRLIAIRYMEVKEVLPDYVKILGNDGIIRLPEILNNYGHLGLDKTEIEYLKMNGQEETAYRKLFLAQSNKLGEVMPFLFEPLKDWTELVLPDKMLEPDGIIDRIVQDEGLTNSFEEGAEAIGWLYQFYMSEKKKQVGGLKNNVVKKEDLPVVTQLFTPRWIVDYMIENTIGKLYEEWDENSILDEKWKYYMKNQTSKKLMPDFGSNIENLTFFDPACGSGHILVAAFEYFYDMYIEQGYRRTEICQLILEKNLFGCDIDRRAAQIANFALYMKAAEKDSRFLRRTNLKATNVHEMYDAETLTEEEWNWLTKDKSEQQFLQAVIEQFEHGKQFGSLIQSPIFGYDNFITRIESELKKQSEDLYEEALKLAVAEKLLPILRQAKLLAQRYDIVVTNPPYHNKYNPLLKKFMGNKYKEYKSDLYSAFIYRCIELVKDNGYVGMMTPFNWMFITSHQKLREHIIQNYSFSSLIQLEYSAFEEATVPICTFVIQKQNQDPIGEYIRLSDLKGDQSSFVRNAIENPNVDYRYQANSKNFSAILESPIAYWTDESVRKTFQENRPLDEVVDVRQGLATADNNRFLRYWWEVNYEKIGFRMRDAEEAKASKKKWFPFNKGGEFRKWYGNLEYVINWENDGEEAKQFATDKYKNYTRILKNLNYMFREGVTWSGLTSGSVSARYIENGFLFDVVGSSLFSKEINQDPLPLLALMNSQVVNRFLAILNPTMHYQVGDVKRIPIKSIENIIPNLLVNENIQIAKQEWNSKEVSWDFCGLSMGNSKGTTIAEVFQKNMVELETWKTKMLNNEKEINAIVLAQYNTSDATSDEDLYKELEKTIRPISRKSETTSFLSYFIGCCLGRYSLDQEGIIYSGGEWSALKYQKFQPSIDGIITLTDEKVLSNDQDIYERLKEFLTVIYSLETLEENLAWLAESLGKKTEETVEQTIRSYFVKDFFKDHIQLYQKRPIYWQIDSGRQKGMQSLIYLHRYTPQTMGLAMQNHFVPLLSQWRHLAKMIEEEINAGFLSATDKKTKVKQLNIYLKRVKELEDFQDKLNEIARQEIVIDLDDGVKVNYPKFESVLTKIKF